MTRKHGPAGWVARAAILAGIAGIVAACSSGRSSGPGSAPVASLTAGGGQAGHAPGGPPTTAQTDLYIIHFARCMRSHGVAMSDPSHRPGHTGLTINMPSQDAATRQAFAACMHFIRPIIQAKQAGGAGAASAPRLAALTRYADCMRGHDISMLDPTPAGELNLGNVPGITSNFGRYSPQFRAADAACRHLLPAGVHDDGTGP